MFARLYLKGKKKKLSVGISVCHPRNVRKPKLGELQSRLDWEKTKTLSPK
jgi:hypothetical protein